MLERAMTVWLVSAGFDRDPESKTHHRKGFGRFEDNSLAHVAERSLSCLDRTYGLETPSETVEAVRRNPCNFGR